MHASGVTPHSISDYCIVLLYCHYRDIMAMSESLYVLCVIEYKVSGGSRQIT